VEKVMAGEEASRVGVLSPPEKAWMMASLYEFTMEKLKEKVVLPMHPGMLGQETHFCAAWAVQGPSSG
jgi:hypothetical protein